MSEFAERFNSKYREKVAQTKLDYEKKNRKFEIYKKMVEELFSMIEDCAVNTPIEIETDTVNIEKKINFFDTTTEALPKIKAKLENYYIEFTPLGLDYQTGSAKIRIDHNNKREKPASFDIFMRTDRTAEDPNDDNSFVWQIKIGYQNFQHFDRELLENLLETVFLS